MMNLRDSYTSPDQLINLMNEQNTIFLFEDLLLCFLGFFLDLNTLAERLLLSYYIYAVMLLYIRFPHQPFFLVQFFLQKHSVFMCVFCFYFPYIFPRFSKYFSCSDVFNHKGP